MIVSTAAGVDRSLRISVNMVTKALLQYLMLLAPDPDFPELWARILQVLQVCFQPHPTPPLPSLLLPSRCIKGMADRFWSEAHNEVIN